ncbi:MAG TPA: PLP-dependent aminotransferase family protein [Acidiphilium sp.]
MSRQDYRRIAEEIAEEIAADIAAGRLKPGERLLPQREFAWRRGIAPSTAARVYRALFRSGLVDGEIGRGTFVRASPSPASAALSEPAAAAVDLELNFPILTGQADIIARALEPVLRPENLDAAMRPVGHAATRPAQETIAGFLGRGGWAPEPDGILLTGNGRQAIAASLSALAPAGSRIGVEALTYPVMLAIAEHLRLDVVPIEMDREGIVPERLEAIHRATPLRALYLQPLLHNPLGASMGGERRARIAGFLREHDVPTIEDAIYAFLADEAPLTALAPDHVVVIDSFSKRIAPGLTLGMIAAGAKYRQAIARAIRSGVWAASGFPLAASLRLIEDGTAGRVQADKREDAIARQEIARTCLAGCDLTGDPRAYHLLMGLPRHWRAEDFVAAAAKHGVATVSARAFAPAGNAPNAIRLALGSPPQGRLIPALTLLRDLALAGPAERDVG